MHVNRTTGTATSRETATTYHNYCVSKLIQLNDTSHLLGNGVALAAACLLRSYEILDGRWLAAIASAPCALYVRRPGCATHRVEVADVASTEDRDPNRHLQGAYSFAFGQSLVGGSINELREAGVWNYLREAITFSLFESCTLKIDLNCDFPPANLARERSHLDSASTILARILNAAFGGRMVDEVWAGLLKSTQRWLAMLPEQFHAFSAGKEKPQPVATSFPRLWFLQDYHGMAA